MTPNDLVNEFPRNSLEGEASNVECSFSIIGLQLEHSILRTNSKTKLLERTFLIWVYHLVMTNIAMERSTIFKNGKPSVSIRAMA